MGFVLAKDEMAGSVVSYLNIDKKGLLGAKQKNLFSGKLSKKKSQA
jgi:hypothetical protein